MNSDSENSRPAAVQPWRYLLWLIIFGVMAWQVRNCIHAGWRDELHPNRDTDFSAFYAAGRLALSGENIYDFKKSGITGRPFLYPPTFAILPMMLLARLPYNAALLVFLALNYALLFGTLWLLRDALWRLVPQPVLPSTEGSNWRRLLLHPDTGMMLAAAICFRFVHGNLRLGNSNLFVTFFLALALWCMLQNRKPLREFSSGASIALATAIKVTPGLYGLYLLWSWRPRGMLGGALGLLFFLIVVPATVMGIPTTLERLTQYKSHLSAATTGDGADADQIGHEGGADQKQLEGGISLRGTWMRYLTPRPLIFTFKDKTQKLYYANFVNLPEATARNIAHGGEALLLLLTAFLTGRKAARLDPAGVALSWGVVATAMVLLSPLTRKAHLCVLLIPAAVAIALMQKNRIVGFARRFCIATLAAICLEGAVFSVNFIGELNSDWLQMWGIGFWMLLAVYASLAWALWKLKTPDESAVPQASPLGVDKGQLSRFPFERKEYL